METVNSSSMNNAQAMALKKMAASCMVWWIWFIQSAQVLFFFLFSIQSTHEINECDSCFQIQ